MEGKSAVKKEPQYIKIYNDLLGEILDGHLKEGDQLSTEMELSKKYGVSRITSKKALDMLVQDGKIIRIAGKGSFVSSDLSGSVSKKKRTPVIGVAISGFTSAFGFDFLAGIQDACKEHHYLAAISKAYSDHSGETAEISHLISAGVCGLILMPLHGMAYNPTILSNLLSNFPMVMADRYLPGLSVPYVGNNNTHSAQVATQYLFEKGLKNVAFFSSLSTTSALQERLEGYINAYAQSDLQLNANYIFTDIHCTMPGMTTEKQIQDDLAHVKSFLLQNPQITAGLAADYGIARFIHTALQQLGKEVPRDFSIICYDQPEELFRERHYTHIRQNQYQIGYQSANLLFQLLEKKTITKEKYIMDYQLIEGDSVIQLPS